jgi:hydrogenase nickel incorporation protein HypA/HybF
MHEWALAEAVIATAVRVAQRDGLVRIREVEVRVGELQQIERDVFEFALQHALPTDNRMLDGVAFAVSTEPAELRCRACEHEWLLGDSLAALPEEQREAVHFLPETAHVYVRCPRCGSPDFDIVRGRGVSLASVAGDPAGDPAGGAVGDAAAGDAAGGPAGAAAGQGA